MLTPSFEARQDNDSIILSIRVPFVKVRYYDFSQRRNSRRVHSSYVMRYHLTVLSLVYYHYGLDI